ncbi:MAG: trans-2,3-dihydro-3-hydroxyanthranilate isomerase [Gammaproteobacteria bacterium]|jgi:trans-2,3-dihydro-3-hydroxyanthranilate isomerase
MKYKFYTCDVFTHERFGGNPLAVIPNANGISSEQMQTIAREFNYSETTFVLPGDHRHTRKVRIFTPTQEVPFAGHPNIGTAFTLASIGELGDIGEEKEIIFDELAGPVPILIRWDGTGIWCELKAPEPLSIREIIALDQAASALSVTSDDILTATHQPQVASVGLPFIMVELKDWTTLEKVSVNTQVLEEVHGQGITSDILVYIRSQDEFDIRCRVFAPLDGVPEDPATGSANCALVSMLSHYCSESEGHFAWRIAQGVKMNRPSLLEARVQKQSGSIIGSWIGGSCKMVMDGSIRV